MGDRESDGSTDAELGRTELELGRRCHSERAWAEAYDALSRADQQCALEAADLERLAEAAYLIGRDTEYLKALERAQLAYVKAGDERRAARCLFWLGLRLLFRGEGAQAGGWLGRAQRLLERQATSSAEQGYLLLPLVEQRLAAGDRDAAFEAAERAAVIGERFDEPDLVAIARHQQGRARLEQERIQEGLGLLDEAMVMVLSGQLSPIVTGLLYCSVIDACQQVHALARVGEWTATLSQWCQQQPELVAFIGVCSVHRAEVLERAGAWAEARDEAERVCDEGRCRDPKAASAATYLLGDLHRLKGELRAADDAYRKASELGWEPQPGLALLRLAEGQPEVAVAGIRRALQVAQQPGLRAKLLPPYVEVMLAGRHLDEARDACAELSQLAERLASQALVAAAAQAQGALQLAQGRASAAVSSLLRAQKLWQELQAPHALAKTRVLIARAHQALGDQEGGALELAAARGLFERLGAATDLRGLESLDSSSSRTEHGLTARELEVLRLVSAGETNKAIAAKLFVSDRTIDRHVGNIFAKLGVSSRAAATAYAYQHRLV
jgi:DNA-binding CsgD family transcriptional regulator